MSFPGIYNSRGRPSRLCFIKGSMFHLCWNLLLGLLLSRLNYIAPFRRRFELSPLLELLSFSYECYIFKIFKTQLCCPAFPEVRVITSAEALIHWLWLTHIQGAQDHDYLWFFIFYAGHLLLYSLPSGRLRYLENFYSMPAVSH